MIYLSLNLSRRRSVLRCAARAVWPSGRVIRHKTLGRRMSSAISRQQQPAGSFPSALANAPPAWPCLYLDVQREELMQTSLLSDGRNAE